MNLFWANMTKNTASDVAAEIFYFMSPAVYDNNLRHYINPSLAEQDIPYFSKQCRSRSVGLEANWSGSALFVIKYVNLYQQPGSSNLIGWKLEVGVAS